jgi:hypothetical protein
MPVRMGPLGPLINKNIPDLSPPHARGYTLQEGIATLQFSIRLRIIAQTQIESKNSRRHGFPRTAASVAQPFPEQGQHHLWAGLALRSFHHLAHKPVQQRLLTLPVLAHLLGMGGDDLVH